MPRRYDKTRRAQLEAETRERIMRATVALHAVHGALGTSYAMIAEKAGVSPQTVYNHYPNLGKLVHGCTSHVARRAPPVDASCLGDARTAEGRLRRLAEAAYAQLAFMAPWLRLGWSEAEKIPELGAILDRGRAELRRLVARAVAPDYRATPEFVDTAMALLDYPAWKSLSARRSQAKAAKLAGDCLAALLPTLTRTSSKEST